MKWRKPKNRVPHAGGVLLKDFLNAAHPLYRLAGVVNWAQFERQFGQLYADDLGRPALAQWREVSGSSGIPIAGTIKSTHEAKKT